MLDELQRRNYSPSTFRGYIQAVKQFADYFDKSPDKLGTEEVRRFQLHLLREKKLEPSTVKVIYHPHSGWHEEAPSKGAVTGSPRRGQRQ